MIRRPLPALSLLAVSGIALAGCAASASGEPSAAGDGVTIVASTSVYADLASAVVGDAAEVTAVIDSPTQDPHSYESTARDQLAVDGADIAILNGGGYDHFMEDLVASAGTAHVITAVEHAHDYPGAAEHSDEGHADEHAEETPAADEHSADEHAEDEHAHEHIEGFNEHVWYDPHTIVHVVEAIAEEAVAVLPDDAAAIEENRDALIGDIEGLEARLEDLAGTYAGAHAFYTEPIGGYLAAAAGLEDGTPEGFAEAVEEGQDVPPATLLAAIEALEGGDVDVVVANTQTGGAETQRVLETAEAAGVPIVEYSETLPEGETYASWMAANIDALEGALRG
jgi:zinc/manganese transport system substrate-binding protein